MRARAGASACSWSPPGPGATNSVTPVRDCQADSVPVVLICGQVPRAAMGTDAFQEAPVFNIMASCAKHVFLLTDEHKVEATMRSAFELARSGRPGPVVVDIPRDVQLAESVFQGGGLPAADRLSRAARAAQPRHDLTPRDAEAFFRLLGAAKRPLIYAGGGVINSDAAPELRKFAKRFHIPVVTTLMGIGAVDTTSDLSLRMLGMHGTAFANYAVEDCDFLFAVGSRFDDRVAGKVKEFAPQREDRPPRRRRLRDRQGEERRLGARHRRQARPHPAAQGRREPRLQERLQPIGTGTSASCGRATRSTTTASRTRIQAEYVLEQLNEITRGNAIVTTGVGQHQMWAAQYLDFIRPRTFLTSGSMGTMGFGLPAAVGAQLANPGALVIDVDGDGSIRMNLGELETLTTYDIPVKVLLLNNLGDGMVRQWQDLFYANRYSGSDKTLHKKDFVNAVEADGFGFAKRVTEQADVRPTLDGVRQLPRPGLPRGHGRPDRARLPDGRSRHGLQGHDHRQVDPQPRAGRSAEEDRRAGGVLLTASARGRRRQCHRIGTTCRATLPDAAGGGRVADASPIGGRGRAARSSGCACAHAGRVGCPCS